MESRYETPHYAQLFRNEANANGDRARKNQDAKEHLRDTLTKIMKAFEGDIDSQKMIIKVVHNQGHDGHLLRRLTNAMTCEGKVVEVDGIKYEPKAL